MIEHPFDDVVNDQNVTTPELEAVVKEFIEKNPEVYQTPLQAPSPELTEAVKKFKEQFAERSFSQRHEELGKMIDCRLCGRRHREGDPLAKESRAHGEQKFGDVEIPSRSVTFKKQRINPHHNDKVRRFVRLTKKIFDEDIAPYFHAETPEEQENLVRRAQRRAAHILRKFWIKPRIARKNMQDVSRRINRGLLPGGSR